MILILEILSVMPSAWDFTVFYEYGKTVFPNCEQNGKVLTTWKQDLQIMAIILLVFYCIIQFATLSFA